MALIPKAKSSATIDKAVYTTTVVTCGRAGAVIKLVYQSILAGAVKQKLPVNTKKANGDR